MHQARGCQTVQNGRGNVMAGMAVAIPIILLVWQAQDFAIPIFVQRVPVYSMFEYCSIISYIRRLDGPRLTTFIYSIIRYARCFMAKIGEDKNPKRGKFNLLI